MALVHIEAKNNEKLSDVKINQGASLAKIDVSNNPELAQFQLPAGLTSAFKDFISTGSKFSQLSDEDKVLKTVWDAVVDKLPEGDLQTFLAQIGDQDVVNFIYEGITEEKKWKTDPTAKKLGKASGQLKVTLASAVEKAYNNTDGQVTKNTATIDANKGETSFQVPANGYNTVTMEESGAAATLENVT